MPLLRFIGARHGQSVCRAWSACDLAIIELLTMAVELVLVVRSES